MEIDNEEVIIDKTIKYRCAKCSAGIYKAKSNGRDIYVHKCANGWANHGKHCPEI